MSDYHTTVNLTVRETRTVEFLARLDHTSQGLQTPPLEADVRLANL